MRVNVTTNGFRELEAALAKIERKATQKGVMRRALKKAAQPMVDAARAKAPVKDGDLAASIGLSTKLSKRQAGKHRKMFRNDKAAVEAFVGPSGALGAGGRHGHLVEFGTSPHINKGKFAGTKHPGTSAQPFMRPAWDAEAQPTIDRLGVEMWTDIEKTAARAARKAAKG